MALSVAYSVCITVICVEVVVILGLVLFLCRKPSDAGGQLKPDPDNVITQLPTHEPEETGNREYTIEYDNSQPSEEDEPEPETNKINEVPPSPPEMPTSGGLIGDRIKLPVRRATSSSSSSSDHDIPPAVETPKLDPAPGRPSSVSSEPSSVKSIEIPFIMPTIPTDVNEEDLVSGNYDVEFDNGWRKSVSLSALQRSGRIDKSTIDKYLDGDITKDALDEILKPSLHGEEPLAGIVMIDTGEKKSIFKAAKEGYIKRPTAIALLEAQAATGNIIDPLTGRKMSVNEAAEMNFIDKVYEQCLLRAERAVHGYKTRLSDEKLSTFEAMERGLVVEESAIKMLEAQLATGGIIDVRENHRIPIDWAVKRNLINERIYRVLKLKNDEKMKMFEDPNNDEKIHYDDLMAKCIVDHDTGLRLLPFNKPSKGVLSQSSSLVSSKAASPVQSDIDEGLDRGSARSIDEPPVLQVVKAPDDIVDDIKEDAPDLESEEALKSPKDDSSPKIQSPVSSKPDKSLSIGGGDSEAEGLKSPKLETISKSSSKASSKHSPLLEDKKILTVAPEEEEEVKSEKSESVLSDDAETIDTMSLPPTELDEDEEKEKTPPKTPEPEPKQEAPKKPIPISEKIDKFAQKIKEVQEREREEEERERKEKEKQKREEEVIAAKNVKSPVVSTKAKKETKPKPKRDEYTTDDASELSLGETDPEQSELSPNTTSDAASVRGEEKEKEKVLRKTAPVLDASDHGSSSDTDDPKTVVYSHEVLTDPKRKSKRKKKDSKKKKDKDQSLPSTPKTPKSKKSTPKTPKKEFVVPVEAINESPDEIMDGDVLGPKQDREDINFTTGWRKQCKLVDLLEAGLISENMVQNIENGQILLPTVEEKIQQWLHGTSPVAGLLITQTGEKMSLYSAAKRGFLRRGTAVSLLEAQAATGNVIDPITGEYMAVEEATRKGLIDKQYEQILVRAEKAVNGYKTKNTEDVVPINQALQRGILTENHAIRLLEAQIATGGIIDPFKHHRCTTELALERGLLDEQCQELIQKQNASDKGFFDPNTEENLNYSELLERCVVDAETGLLLLPFKKKPPEEKLSGPLAKVLFESELRRKVTLQDVVEAELIEPETLKRFTEGEMSAHEVKQLVDSLKIHVEGSMPIAGVINAENGQKLSIYQATKAGLIRKGTAYELLEAQAACGKIVDVQTGRVLSVETASKTGVFDAEYEDVVTRASRAVIGYREPFKKEILSLCEAISRHLVVERNGVRLLEAQVATGGIIDMKSPLRLSIEAASRKGLLESRLAKQLQARSSKSYFDPNTGENLNYAALMERCVTDPDNGLLFLAVEVTDENSKSEKHKDLMGAVTPKVEPFEPAKSKKLRSNSVDPEPGKKKKKKDKDRSQSEPRPGSPKKKKDKKDKKDKKKKKDKDSSKDSRSEKSEKVMSPKSQKSFTSIEIDPPATTTIDIDMPGSSKMKEPTPLPSKEDMLGVPSKKEKKKKKKRDRSKEKEAVAIQIESSDDDKIEVTSEEPSKKKKKKKPSKKPNKPPKIVSRKVVIVDPDGNELNLEDALKYGYIDQKNYEELKNQENEYDDK